MIALLALGLLAIGLVGLSGRKGTAKDQQAGNTVRVVTVTRPIAAGVEITLDAIGTIDLPSSLVPDGALVEPGDVALRRPAIALPARIPLVASMLARRKSAPAGVTLLAENERAIGLLVDGVAGLPTLLRAGGRIDVMFDARQSSFTVENVRVVEKPSRIADGDGWRLIIAAPTAIAVRIAETQDAGARIRVLARPDTTEGLR